MSADIDSRPVGRARSRQGSWASRAMQTYAGAFIALFGAGVFLGTGWTGHPALPGATILLVPAGAMLLVPALAHLVGPRSHGREGGPAVGRVWAGAAIGGLALIGLGMLSVGRSELWRALTLPLTLAVIDYLIAQLRHRPSRSPLFVRARERGRMWMWQAYAGSWIVLLVCPVFVAWGLGLITVL